MFDSQKLVSAFSMSADWLDGQEKNRGSVMIFCVIKIHANLHKRAQKNTKTQWPLMEKMSERNFFHGRYVIARA